jgi:hypothetical protein
VISQSIRKLNATHKAEVLWCDTTDAQNQRWEYMQMTSRNSFSKGFEKIAATSWLHNAHKTMNPKKLANHSSTGLKAMKAAKGLK